MKIALAVCGSIAAYKSFDLVRLLKKQGHEVKVILTKGALEFVKENLYHWLGAQEVYGPDHDFTHTKNIAHIEIGNWADKLVIAPATANTMAKLSCGIADDMLSNLFLAWPQEKPIIFFPAMNTRMLKNPITQENFSRLGKNPNVFIHPTTIGLLACNEEGEGKLPSPELIASFVESYTTLYQDKTILITTGATINPLDPVRYLTNASSGKTGLLLAQESLARGYRTIVIAGIHSTNELEYLISHPLMTLVRVKTTQDMAHEVEKYLPQSDIYISSAAISDWEFETSNQKIKKEKMKEGHLNIKPAKDILQYSILNKKPHQKFVGFAAETDLSQNILQEKFDRKPVDLLIGTKVDNGLTGNQVAGFQKEGADYLILSKGIFTDYKDLSKKSLANLILNSITEENYRC